MYTLPNKYFLPSQGHPTAGGWLPHSHSRPSQHVRLCESTIVSPTRQHWPVAREVAHVPADVCVRRCQVDQRLSDLVGAHG